MCDALMSEKLTVLAVDDDPENVMLLVNLLKPLYKKAGVELGAMDYIIKPIDPQCVKERIATHLMRKISEPK